MLLKLDRFVGSNAQGISMVFAICASFIDQRLNASEALFPLLPGLEFELVVPANAVYALILGFHHVGAPPVLILLGFGLKKL